MNNYLKNIRNDTVVLTQFNALSLHLPGVTSKNNETLRQNNQSLGRDFNLGPPK